MKYSVFMQTIPKKKKKSIADKKEFSRQYRINLYNKKKNFRHPKVIKEQFFKRKTKEELKEIKRIRQKNAQLLSLLKYQEKKIKEYKEIQKKINNDI